MKEERVWRGWRGREEERQGKERAKQETTVKLGPNADW
jgi:hypothetical protein